MHPVSLVRFWRYINCYLLTYLYKILLWKSWTCSLAAMESSQYAATDARQSRRRSYTVTYRHAAL